MCICIFNVCVGFPGRETMNKWVKLTQGPCSNAPPHEPMAHWAMLSLVKKPRWAFSPKNIWHYYSMIIILPSFKAIKSSRYKGKIKKVANTKYWRSLDFQIHTVYVKAFKILTEYIKGSVKSIFVDNTILNTVYCM